jgi:hypothetical protein
MSLRYLIEADSVNIKDTIIKDNIYEGMDCSNKILLYAFV